MSNCTEGEDNRTSTPLKIVLACQIGISFLAILINIRFINGGFKKIYFHKNAKISLTISLLFNVTHSIFIIILQGTHLILFLFAKSGCDVYVPVKYCIILRGLISFTMAGFVPANVSLVMERMVATIKAKNYENRGVRLGYGLGLLTLIYSGLMVYISLKKTPLSGEAAYCAAANKFTADDITMTSYMLTGTEFVAIAAFVSFWFVNRHRQKRRVFNVTEAYQVHENLAALHILLPWMIFHFVLFTAFYLANTIIPLTGSWTKDAVAVRVTYAAVYIVPIYCALSPFLLSWIVHNQEKMRKGTLKRLSGETADSQAYEQYYKQLW